MNTVLRTWFDAVAAGDIEQVRELLGRDPSTLATRVAGTVSPLRTARYRGHLDVVELLLSAGIPLDIHDAVTVGDTETARGLIDADPGVVEAPSVDGFKPLHLAAYYGEVKITELLLNRGADPEVVSDNPPQVRPLNSAADGGHHVVVHLLLDRGADIEGRMAGGFTPLHAAAYNGDLAMARLLIERGADPHALTDDGRSVVDLAGGDPEFTQALKA